MGVSRVANSDQPPYDRHLAYVVDDEGRPMKTVLMHEQLLEQAKGDSRIVFAYLPTRLHEPMWDGSRWRESKPWKRFVLPGLIVLLLMVIASLRAHGQTAVVVTGQQHGTSTSQQSTVTCTDANHCALDVNITGGGGTGGGPADAASNAAASETDNARQKVTAVLRLLDTGQAAGSQLVTAKGDQTSGIWVNCKAGCSSAADTVGSTTALGALNNAATVALTGTNSASVLISGGGNLVGTLVPEISNDGGTTWAATFFEDPTTHALTTSQAVSSPAATILGIILPGGASNARVRVSAYTSGSSNGTLRATAQVPNRPMKVSATGVLAVDGSGVTQPGNVTQWNGNTVDSNSGVKSAGTLRVVLATDQPALTNKLLVTPDSVALPLHQSVNVDQIGGTGVVADPCQQLAKNYDSFSITANTQIITGTSAKKIYFCDFHIVVGAATNVAVVEGTGSVCGTGTAKLPGLSGGTTAAGGWNFAANGGLVMGNGGAAVAQEGTNADNVCILVSAANQVSGGYSYVVF